MKVSVIGCSTAWTDRPTSSYCVNNTTLIDCGEGTLKFYKKANVNFLHIKNIFITHLHSDHTFALMEYIDQYIFYSAVKDRKSVTIYGPKGLREFLDNLKLASCEYKEIDYNLDDYFNIIEIEDFSKQIKVDNLIVYPYLFKHGKMDNISYVFDDGKVKVGFSGDITMQEGLNKFIENTNTVFLECCSTNTSENHLGYNDYIIFQNKYTHIRFLAIHCVDKIYNNEKELNIECAKHGTIYEF